MQGSPQHRCFNSKLVRLKVQEGYKLLSPQLGFNSKLVRLKAYRACTLRGRQRAFQFQIGSIKSPPDTREFPPSCLGFNSKLVRLKVRRFYRESKGALFQFQIGSIKSLYRGSKRVSIKSFNSKLVRLKVRNVTHAVLLRKKFQFQIGSIKRTTLDIGWSVFVGVSIPNWFD